MKARNPAGRKIIFQIMILLAAGVFYFALHLAKDKSLNAEKDAERISQNLTEEISRVDTMIKSILEIESNHSQIHLFQNDSLLNDLEEANTSLLIFDSH